MKTFLFVLLLHAFVVYYYLVVDSECYFLVSLEVFLDLYVFLFVCMEYVFLNTTGVLYCIPSQFKTNFYKIYYSLCYIHGRVDILLF